MTIIEHQTMCAIQNMAASIRELSNSVKSIYELIKLEHDTRKEVKELEDRRDDMKEEACRLNKALLNIKSNMILKQ